MLALGFQKVIVLLLILTIGKAPVPLVHSHEGIQEEHLEQHLDLCHVGVTELELSSAWHMHLLWIGLAHHTAHDGFGVENAEGGKVFDEKYLLTIEWDAVSSFRRSRDHQVRRTLRGCSLSPHTSRTPVLAAAHDGSILHRCASPGSNDRLFQRYCSLLL